MGVYEPTRRERAVNAEKEKKEGSVLDRLLCFTTGMAFSKTAIAPIERVKILLQVQDASATIPPNKRYKGIINALARVPREQGGFSALYRGNLANVLCLVPGPFVGIVFSNANKKLFLDGLDKKKDFWKFLAGSMASAATAAVTSLCFVYPLDYAHTRLSADIGTGRHREFKARKFIRGIADCLAKTIKSDGLIGIYRGFFASSGGLIVNRAAMIAAANWTADGERTFFSILLPIIGVNFLAYPFDTVSRRMMMQSGRKKVLYKSNLDCLLKIANNQGLGALYKGFLASALGTFGLALAMSVYGAFWRLPRQLEEARRR